MTSSELSCAGRLVGAEPVTASRGRRSRTRRPAVAGAAAQQRVELGVHVVAGRGGPLALDVAQRVVEVGGVGGDVGVGPGGVARLGPTGGLERGEEVGGVPQAAGPQLEPDEGGEGLLGRPATGAATTDRLAEGLRLRQVRRDGGSRHDVDPALDEGEQGLEPEQGGLLRRGLLGGEEPTGEGLLHGVRVGGVDRAQTLLDGVGVDRRVAGVVAHGGKDLRGEPRDGVEQAGPGALAHGEVQPGLGLVDLEPLGEGGDGLRA